MRLKRKRAYVVPLDKGWTISYSVRQGKTCKAQLLKDFYSKTDAEKYRDMVNGKIPRDIDWMYNC